MSRVLFPRKMCTCGADHTQPASVHQRWYEVMEGHIHNGFFFQDDNRHDSEQERLSVTCAKCRGRIREEEFVKRGGIQ